MDQYTCPEVFASALVTIDMQNDFVLEGAPMVIPGTRVVVANIVRLLLAYRRLGLPIVHVVRLYPPDGGDVELCRRASVQQGLRLVAPDSEGAELVAELKPDGDTRLRSGQLLDGVFQAIGTHEFVMYKPRWGAFYRTELETFLRQRGITTLAFCGCNYPNCPRSSIYQASERDFRILVLRDALSQLYPRGEQELQAIGVQLSDTDAWIGRLSSQSTGGG